MFDKMMHFQLYLLTGNTLQTHSQLSIGGFQLM